MPWTASDATSGVSETRLWVRYEGGSWAYSGLWATGTSGTFTYAPTYGDGTYTFATRAADAAGNWEAIPTGDGDAHTFQDTTSPTSSASSPAASSTPTFTVTWSGSADAVSYDVQVQVDGGSSRCA